MQSVRELTERQRHEFEYHREHAREHADLLQQAFTYDVLDRPSRRWWNAYWGMYAFLSKIDLAGKRVLIVGCGFGDDALRVAKMGGDVYAFDLSPDSLQIARALAEREGLPVTFHEMAAETLDYPDGFFDIIIARDILHHVDIPSAMMEIARVAKSGALLVVNEIYSHSIADRVRHSALVEKVLYRRMQPLIYGADKPYITQDERKLTERDVEAIERALASIELRTYYNFLVTRILPDTSDLLGKLDRLLLLALKPLSPLLGGRVMVFGTVRK